MVSIGHHSPNLWSKLSFSVTMHGGLALNFVDQQPSDNYRAGRPARTILSRNHARDKVSKVTIVEVVKPRAPPAPLTGFLSAFPRTSAKTVAEKRSRAKMEGGKNGWWHGFWKSRRLGDDLGAGTRDAGFRECYSCRYETCKIHRDRD